MRKVEFLLGQDDNTGDWGAILKTCRNTDFNYFWTHQGLFHDLIEHWFEGIHKYFKGKYAFNVGGELFAMGISYSVYNNFVPYDRPFNNNQCYNTAIERECIHLLSELEEGYSSFGNELLCCIPYQRPQETYLERMIQNIEEKHYKYRKETRRFLRAGFKEGEKFKRTWESEQNLYKLFQALKRIVKMNAEELSYEFKGFTITYNNKFKHKIKWNRRNIY